MPTYPKRERHRWVKLRIHVYICRVCGMGKVNGDSDGVWRTTYHFPSGVSRVEHLTPPCDKGALTEKYLSKYKKEILEWKGHREAIGKPDGSQAEDAPF